MRVLMVADGRCIHAKRPLQWILNAGHEVTFVDSANPLPLGRNAYQFRSYPRARGLGVLSQLAGQSLGIAVAERIQAWRLNCVYRLAHPDVTHVHWIDTRAYQVARFGARPLILTAWGSDINALAASDCSTLLRQQVAFALRKADLLTTDAPDIARRCEQIAECRLNSVLLPLGIDSFSFSRNLSKDRLKWRAKLKLSTDTFVFGSMRAWTPRYNHDQILEAFARAVLDAGQHIALLFKMYHPSGEDKTPEYRAKLQARVESLGLQERVRWVDDIAGIHLPEIYATVDAVVNYPQIDGFPVHFLEAAAARKPVITCQLPAYEGSFAESCFHLVKANDINALAQTMVRVVRQSSDPTAKALLETAHNLVAAEYQESLTAAKLLRLYESLLAERYSVPSNNAPS